MSIYVQHGHGKTDKIERAADAGVVDGVILSPRHETPANLAAYARGLRRAYPALTVALDPQFYATTMARVNDGRLPDYDYYHPRLTRAAFVSPRNVQQYVREVLEYQARLQVSYLIAPTVRFDTFRDPWSQVSLSMAQQAVEHHAAVGDDSPLLLSLVFSENALNEPEAVADFLDIVSAFDATGFYLIVDRMGSGYQPHMDPTRLEQLLHMVYALTTVNEYRVIVGYCDLVGILLHAVGAHAAACGWHHGMRQFSLANLQPREGGRRALPRYTSIPLLSSIQVVPELSATHSVGRIGDVLTGTPHDGPLATNPAGAPWPAHVRCAHHWAALAAATQHVVTSGSIGRRLDTVLEMIAMGRAVFAGLESLGVSFDVRSGPAHLVQWQTAIQNFRHQAGV